jgi:rhomboid protease GluP
MWTIYTLVGLNVAVSLLVHIHGRAFTLTPLMLIRWGGMYAPFVRRRELHRLVAPIFLHGGLEHVLGNMYALIIAGVLFVERQGQARTVLVYLVTGVAGFFVSYLWRLRRPIRDQPKPHWYWSSVRRPLAVCVGASGAICGLLAALLVQSYLTGESGVRETMLLWLCMLLGYGLLPGIDNAAHLGGTVAGAVFGLLLPLGTKNPAHLAGLSPAALVPFVVAAVSLGIARRRPALDTVEILWNRGVGAKDPVEKIAAYQQVLALHPEHALALYNMALAFETRGEKVAALDAVERAIKLDPKEPDALAVRERLTRP